MKCAFLGFLLLIMIPLFGAAEADASEARVTSVRVACREIEGNGDIKISCGAVSYTHSFSLEILQPMNREYIDTAVMYLLENASTIDELSILQKDMIAILANERAKVEEIVNFLFAHSRRADIPALVLPHSPPWGKSR